MNTLLRDMPLFVEVARHKSFTKAAENLDMYISTLSRRIAGLEKDLGVPLFLRSTRQVDLTESGKMLYERCKYLLAETDSLREEVISNMTRAAGPVRVAVSADVYHTYLWGIMGRFAATYPDIRLTVHFKQRWVDLLSEPYDVDIRVGPLPDSELRARKLISLQPVLCVAPKLLERHPKPETPQDLRTFPCITFSDHGTAWTMNRGGHSETVQVMAVHMVNSISLALELGIAGQGAAWLSPLLRRHPAMEFVKDEDFVPILPGWTIPGIDIHVVMPKNQLPHRVRLFVDFLADHIATIPDEAKVTRALPEKAGKKRSRG